MVTKWFLQQKCAQRGHMLLLCQGVIAAWRNPRAHALTDDDPGRCLMMLETDDASERSRHRGHLVYLSTSCLQYWHERLPCAL
jgi:hypothetical protein